MYLVIYDLSGIQNFIFQTNAVKEIIGASYIVSKALFANVPEVLSESYDEWKTSPLDDLKTLAPGTGKTIYIGGGNALVLFADRETFVDKTGALQERVFLQTGGALRLCYGYLELTGDDLSRRLGEIYSCLIESLDENKRNSPYAYTAPGFSLNRLDNTTFEPILYFGDTGGAESVTTRSTHLKLVEELTERNGGNSTNNQSNSYSYKNHLTELFKGYKFKREFSKFFDPDTNDKRFLAFVHIDGNTMGQKITKYLEESLPEKNGLIEDLQSMRKLSIYISSVYSDALTEMIESVYVTGATSLALGGQKSGKDLPFRPIIADGDDITFICRSNDAFSCVSAFVNALKNPKNPSTDNSLPRSEDFSVGIGVTFAKQSYPFSTAYSLAEELCKNSKRKTIARLEQGTIMVNKHAEAIINSIDFHVCVGESVAGIKSFRTRFYQGQNYHLSKRPYHFPTSTAQIDEALLFEIADSETNKLESDEPGASASGKSKTIHKDFSSRLQWLHGVIKNKLMARSKLKELRNEYSRGKESADGYGEYVYAREMARLNAKSTGQTTGAQQNVAGELRYAFETIGGQSMVSAKFFDALDVLDIAVPIEPNNETSSERMG